ncbi:SDR family NAD(P)-dependent oxidoreductase [Pseudonocardia alni]|uniref:SDR family NAD(P)-dependent oxidoreductase n=1 Tax=Pseudonocardia alni TaxID=33907 RepID=UPI0033F412A8
MTDERTGRVAGKVALVTGAARGQGRAHVLLLAREGASVLATDVLDDLGEELAEEAVAEGLDVEYLHHDVSDDAQWASVVTHAEDRFGRIDVLVNNAGVVGYTGIVDCPDDEWDRIVAINQTGVFYGLRAVLPLMQRTGGGSVVNVSSVFGGMGGTRGYAAYGASKAAVLYLTRSAALSHGAEGIRVNAIAPGSLDTPMLREEAAHHGVDVSAMGVRSAIPRIAAADEASSAVLWLVSDEASFVTGVILPIDGGLTAAV